MVGGRINMEYSEGKEFERIINEGFEKIEANQIELASGIKAIMTKLEDKNEVKK